MSKPHAQQTLACIRQEIVTGLQEVDGAARPLGARAVTHGRLRLWESKDERCRRARK